MGQSDGTGPLESQHLNCKRLPAQRHRRDGAGGPVLMLVPVPSTWSGGVRGLQFGRFATHHRPPLPTRIHRVTARLTDTVFGCGNNDRAAMWH